MAKLLKLRRGTTTQHSSFTGAEGEVTIDTTKDTAVVHDGSQAGGRPLLREDMANLPAGTIDNADINTSAAISGTKISPDFGSQDIITTGKIKFANVYSTEGDLPSASTYHGMFAHVHATGLAYYAHGGNWHKLAKNDAPSFTGNISSTGNITITNEQPKVSFTDSGNNPDYQLANIDGVLTVYDATNSADRLRVNADGHVDVVGHFDVGAGVDVTGNITTTSGNLVVDGEGTVEDNFRITDSAGTQRLLMGNQDSAGANSPKIFSVGNAALTIGVGDSWSGDGGTMTNQFSIGKTGPITSHINHDFSAGIDVTGNITVTGTVDGRDVAGDGSKLDGIETGATADQTAAEIRTLVDTATDCNVFTNADHGKLDGIESGATADQTASEIVSLISGQSIAPNDVSAGYVYGTSKLGRDSNDYIAWNDNNYLDFVVNGSVEFRMEADGDFHADGDVIAYSTTTASDENLKENIVTITDAVEKVEALKGVTFKWKKNDLVSAGVIAQDVEKVLPEVVKTVGDLDGGEYKAVNYGGLTSILIEAIKDLSARIKVLEAK